MICSGLCPDLRENSKSEVPQVISFRLSRAMANEMAHHAQRSFGSAKEVATALRPTGMTMGRQRVQRHQEWKDAGIVGSMKA
jgi:hypothetical protein